MKKRFMIFGKSALVTAMPFAIGFSETALRLIILLFWKRRAKLSAVCRRFRIRFGYAEGKFRELCSVVFLPIRIIEKRATWGRFSPMK